MSGSAHDGSGPPRALPATLQQPAGRKRDERGAFDVVLQRLDAEPGWAQQLLLARNSRASAALFLKNDKFRDSVRPSPPQLQRWVAACLADAALATSSKRSHGPFRVLRSRHAREILDNARTFSKILVQSSAGPGAGFAKCHVARAVPLLLESGATGYNAL